MKKDYIPVRPEQAALDEIAQVEAQWTQVWQPRLDANAGGGGDLMEREEYRLIAPYLAQVRGGRIMDGGCGMAEYSVFLSHRGYDVYAVDISRLLIAQLATRFPQCHFTCGDIRHMDFADGFFDAYFSWGVFEHFEEGLGQCIAEAWRVIKPGGVSLC